MRPRQVLPGRCLFITRRCTQRTFLLRPDDRVNQAIKYCLAEAAARFDVTVMWFTAMSTHAHYGLFDPDGVYPAFMAHFHKLVAKVLNCKWGRFENLWSSEAPSVVECVEPDDGFGKMIYSLGNPTEHHLVERAHHWPGVTSLTPQLLDKTERVRRPHWFSSTKTARCPSTSSFATAARRASTTSARAPPLSAPRSAPLSPPRNRQPRTGSPAPGSPARKTRTGDESAQ